MTHEDMIRGLIPLAMKGVLTPFETNILNDWELILKRGGALTKLYREYFG